MYNGYEDRLITEKMAFSTILPHLINRDLQGEVDMDTTKYIGGRFGRWTVLEFGFRRKKNNYWNCRCKCGMEKNIHLGNLLSGHSRSCGCYDRKIHGKLRVRRVTIGDNAYKHGKSYTRLYNIWQKMKSRCYAHTNNRYYCYGGRGIKVCDEWRNDFVAFYEWAKENGYKDCLMIDRKDNDKNYAASNCRWVDKYESARNSSWTRVFEYEGKMYALPELAEKFDININTLASRIRRSGYSIKKAINLPIKKKGKKDA